MEHMSEEDLRRIEDARGKQRRERDGKLNDLVLRSALGTRMQVTKIFTAHLFI